MANMYKDFDEMFPSAAGVPEEDQVGRFKIYGKQYTFKKEMPALLMLELTRYEGKVPQRTICKLAYALFGEDVVTEIAMHPGFTFDVLDSLVAYAIKVCRGEDLEGEDSMKELTEDDFGVRKGKKAKN